MLSGVEKDHTAAFRESASQFGRSGLKRFRFGVQIRDVTDPDANGNRSSGMPLDS